MSLLNPNSIAVIGASADEKKVGHVLLRNLMTQGYKGTVYPINPKGGKILGKETFPSVTAVAGHIDLAIIATPASSVLALAEECGKKDVQTLVVITAGFRETGTEEGIRAEEELAAIARRYKMLLVGPNCLGFMRPSISLNASFANDLPRSGKVAFLSQSGALGGASVDRAQRIGLRLSFFLSMGNKALMNECDFLELCEDDPETNVIGLYLEGIVDGRRLLEIGERVAQKKPIVLLKAGTTEKGRKAASSHTGALAGSDAAVDAICRQAGITRAQSVDELLDLLRTQSLQPPLASSRIAIVTNAGGAGVLGTDAAEKAKLSLPSLLPKHEAELQKVLPPFASLKNPIDVLGDALEDRFEAALHMAAKDENIDGIAVFVTPQMMTPVRAIAETIVAVMKNYPLIPTVASFMGGESVHEGIEILHEHGIPNFSCPETAISTLATLWHQEPVMCTHRAPVADEERAAKAAVILHDCHGLLDEGRLQRLFSLYRLPLPEMSIASSAEEAVQIATRIGLPVVAKVDSRDILHKTDIGGVRVNLSSTKAVAEAYEEIMANVRKNAPEANVNGVLIQQCLPAGDEFIVGAIADPCVGHLVMTGLGGIYTELFSDASFRVVPVSEKTAFEMLEDLKAWKILLGMRGKPRRDIISLARLIRTVSLLVTECPQITEIDLNPVLVQEQQIVILDAKVVLGGEVPSSKPQ
jgi:acetyltransferase